MAYEKLPVGKMINQTLNLSNPKKVKKMAKVADKHDPWVAQERERENREIGGRKRDAGRPRRNELQDNW